MSCAPHSRIVGIACEAIEAISGMFRKAMKAKDQAVMERCYGSNNPSVFSDADEIACRRGRSMNERAAIDHEVMARS